MLFLNTVISQEDVILKGLVYYGIPSLIGGLFWLLYTVKSDNKRLGAVEKVQVAHENRLDNLERTQMQHERELSESVLKLNHNVETLSKSIEDMPSKIVANLLEKGLLQLKN